ncbi:tail fiber assembly protein [Lysobacter yananisis]|uniref:Tail fiber assembly protein n=1 Tax=Lysobacter yananisis TaxID=1003114 RepID=A0ABY9P776_9GAMM|nr:tail fiber assembly protein [Lysobacter yananisis]WMT02839.1 tail fiber assembly protein [Lysobacter yananisis]
MYAITDSSYRAINRPDEVGPGETFALEIPPPLLDTLRSIEARRMRSARLRDSDWTQMPDSPLSAAERLAWAGYRTQLRNLPDLPGFPDVEWPQPPVLGEGAAAARAP